MINEQVKALGNHFQDLAVAFSGKVEWQWDGRFNTALTEFDLSRKGEVLEILEQHLVSTWDSSSVKEAPDIVQALSKSLGGLMSGQLLLLSDSNQAAFLFCAWWPWGNGTKISIRIAPFTKNLTAEEASALLAVFRDCFKI